MSRLCVNFADEIACAIRLFCVRHQCISSRLQSLNFTTETREPTRNAVATSQFDFFHDFSLDSCFRRRLTATVRMRCTLRNDVITKCRMQRVLPVVGLAAAAATCAHFPNSNESIFHLLMIRKRNACSARLSQCAKANRK